jgi:hypothetical protein
MIHPLPRYLNTFPEPLPPLQRGNEGMCISKHLPYIWSKSAAWIDELMNHCRPGKNVKLLSSMILFHPYETLRRIGLLFISADISFMSEQSRRVNIWIEKELASSLKFRVGRNKN